MLKVILVVVLFVIISTFVKKTRSSNIKVEEEPHKFYAKDD